MICRFCRATAVNWTLREGMSTGSTHFMLAGNFCDQRRLPFEEKLCKQSSIVPTRIVFSLRINPTAWKVGKKAGIELETGKSLLFCADTISLYQRTYRMCQHRIFWVLLYPIGCSYFRPKVYSIFHRPFLMENAKMIKEPWISIKRMKGFFAALSYSLAT